MNRSDSSTNIYDKEQALKDGFTKLRLYHWTEEDTASEVTGKPVTEVLRYSEFS